jgi:UDP-N-acetylmuramate dehydrogenase
VFEQLEALHIKTGELTYFTNEDCRFGYRESVFKNIYKDKFIITTVTLKLSKYPVINTSYGAIEQTLQNMGITSPSIHDVSNAVIHIRQSKLPDPALMGNAGSFFKNPVIEKTLYENLKAEYPELPGYEVSSHEMKVPAGWLIEQCGWKGKRYGDVGVHKNQALVLVNYGNAAGEAIKELAFTIRASVKEHFDIELTPEVNII